MILYNSELDYRLEIEDDVSEWLRSCITKELKKEGEIQYIFCDDQYLVEKNVKYLNHNTLTDIISFDYTVGTILSGDIFISIERVKENAKEFNEEFLTELCRVMIHGILHFCGYKDKTEHEKEIMRKKEDYYLSLRTFS